MRAHLHALGEQGLLRTLRPPSGIDLSSNDYLALSHHPAVQERMVAAIQCGGCGSTGSRLLRGHREAFEALERAFAAFKGAERALYFSSGYLANLAVLTTLVEPRDVILSDRLMTQGERPELFVRAGPPGRHHPRTGPSVRRDGIALQHGR